MTFLCMTLSISTIDFLHYKIFLLSINPANNVAIQSIYAIRENLLPKNVSLIQTAPTEALFAQIYVAVLLSILLVMPLIMMEISWFIGPGLYPHEKKRAKNIAMPAIILFVTGCIFSYLVVIPYVLNFLYVYGQSIGVTTFFDVEEFVPFVVQFFIAFGLSFQLPIIMWIVTASQIVNFKFWRDNLRYAVLLAAIFGAIITPDGSGVTMWFVTTPILLLYVIGMLIIERKNKIRVETTFSAD
jgi:sec-independent protein translocase protein TatC